jgi:hypothetical protein
VKLTFSADYPQRARHPRQKPSPCARTGRLDAGAGGRTQRRSCHRGQPDRERQARSAGLDLGTTGQGPGSLAGRAAALASGPAPGPKRAAEDRPVSLRAYFVLNVCRSGTTESTDAIFILAHPLPLVGPGLVPGATGEGKDFLNAGILVSANHARAPARTYARTILTSFNRPDQKGWAWRTRS